MDRQRTRIVAAITAVGALIAAALLVLPAQATPPTEHVTTAILAKSRFDAIQVNAPTRSSETPSSRPMGNPTLRHEARGAPS
jgi:hypothetical protein